MSTVATVLRGASVALHPDDHTVSELLRALRVSMPAEGMTLRELLERLGERGLLILCIVLSVPFLLPVSIPGTSIPFAALMALIGVGVAAGRAPWMPRKLLDHRIAASRLGPMLDAGARTFARLEKIMHPRLLPLTHAGIMNRVNGALLVLSAICLMAPLPLPLSNTIPAYAIVLVAAGSLERDGIVILAGWVMVLLGPAYFVAVALLGVEGLRSLVFGHGGDRLR
jgi:hypothetical protein